MTRLRYQGQIGVGGYQTNKLTKLRNAKSGDVVGGNVPDEFIADLETEDNDGRSSGVVIRSSVVGRRLSLYGLAR